MKCSKKPTMCSLLTPPRQWQQWDKPWQQSVSMKHNLLFHMLLCRLQQSPEAVQEAEDAEVVTEVSEGAAEAVVDLLGLRPTAQVRNIKEHSILTFPLEMCPVTVPCISNTGEELFSAMSQPVVRGRMCSLPEDEPGASPKDQQKPTR